jgi:hypothetical protein
MDFKKDTKNYYYSLLYFILLIFQLPGYITGGYPVTIFKSLIIKRYLF